MHDVYYFKALEDLQFLESCLYSSEYNHLAAYCYRVIDKMLRSLIEMYDLTAKNVIRTSRLSVLKLKLDRGRIHLDIDRKVLLRLSEVYANYMNGGVAYDKVDYKDLEVYLATTYALVGIVNTHRRQRGFETVSVKASTLCNTPVVSIDSIFNAYRNKYNIKNNSEWSIELGRLFEVFGTTDMARLSANIKESYLE